MISSSFTSLQLLLEGDFPDSLTISLQTANLAADQQSLTLLHDLTTQTYDFPDFT